MSTNDPEDTVVIRHRDPHVHSPIIPLPFYKQRHHPKPDGSPVVVYYFVWFNARNQLLSTDDVFAQPRGARRAARKMANRLGRTMYVHGYGPERAFACGVVSPD